MFESRCGVCCNSCGRREQVGCRGCLRMERPFWGGTCGVKSCCEGRALNHCGECPEFPCEMLSTMGVEQGFDPAPKLAQCRRWAGERPRVSIRELDGPEADAALELARRVFLEYEAPDYGPEGTEEFQRSLSDPSYVGILRIYGAYAGEIMAGMMATRLNGSHLALLFVERAYQRRGIGRMLIDRARADCTHGCLSVNASPYGAEFYHILGFTDTRPEQVTRGLRYTPMAWERSGAEECRRETTPPAETDPAAMGRLHLEDGNKRE